MKSGVKKTSFGILRKTSGSVAEYLSNESCGYIYPLWKKHKLSPENLKH